MGTIGYYRGGGVLWVLYSTHGYYGSTHGYYGTITMVTITIGGLEAITNYFHLIGSGHVVWMVRRYGNLWRFRNEGIEAFNAIVSLRHNKNNKKGGYKKTRKGDPVRKCAEFWSLVATLAGTS